MFVLNYLTPLVGDDLSMTKYNSLEKLILASEHDYFNWNGRIFGQGFARLLNSMPKSVTDILNSLMMVILTLIILLIVTKDWTKPSILKLVSEIMLLIIALPNFGETVLWHAGAGNYLWVSCLVLGFILVYKRYLDTRTADTLINFRQIMLATIMLAFGGMAGWSNENTAGGCLIIVVLLVIYQIKRDQKVTLWQITGLLGNLIGVIFIAKAPGNLVRTKAGNPEYLQYSLIKKFTIGFDKVSTDFVAHYLVLVITICILASLAYFYYQDIEATLITTFITISGFATIFVLVFSPVMQQVSRSWTGGILYLIIALLIVIPERFDVTIGNVVVTNMVLVLVLLGSFKSINGVIDLKLMSNQINARYQYIDQQKLKGNKIVLVKPYQYLGKTDFAQFMNWDVGTDPDKTPNFHYYDYFGVKVKTKGNR
ncbi:conserved membrane hypothetical protein [Latilactobacillus sakei]|nr:DUF6056 family protein [Latilactobacillus sakei]AWZ46761.1 hypothetical protein CXB69_07315 [Latilactobacillus sakei]MCT3533199.1 hypothetical protein [Latilactobacillus curvatus]UTC13891.1 hypothetical protein A4W80_02610 [Latilactobacillus curvatus]SOB40051.1 conserved membrane hypothetical protein [Latilactobacillus sakei]